MNTLALLAIAMLLGKRGGGAASPIWPTPKSPPPRRPAPAKPVMPPPPPPPPPPPVHHDLREEPKPKPRRRRRKPVRIPPPRSSSPVATPATLVTPDHPPPPAPDAPVVTVTRPHVVKVPSRAETRDAIAAANQLYTYVRAGQPLGTKNRPSDFIADAQRDMGGGLVPDGIYGPMTRARGKQLTGKDFPPRTRGAAAAGGLYIP